MSFIKQLAKDGLAALGKHGPVTAMGVLRHELPHWDDIQVMVAQMATQPLIQVMARACGHDSLGKFNKNDLATWTQEMAALSGIRYSGFDRL